MAANGEAVDLTFDPRLADHLAADRLYYKSTLWAKIDRVVAVVLVVLGSLATWAAGPRWWALIWFPLAFAEWFNLLSLRPLQVMYWFRAVSGLQGFLGPAGAGSRVTGSVRRYPRLSARDRPGLSA